MPLVAIGARLRAICLALPEANEEIMRRGPSYRVGDKIFALERPWNDWLALWCKVPEGSREIIIDAEPARFFVPPYFGAKGWIGVGLDEAADWREIEAFVRRSYRLVASKRLAIWWREAKAGGVEAHSRCAPSRPSWLRPRGRRRGGRVLWPEMAGIAAAKVGADGGPGAAPEAGQIARDLDRPVGGREQMRG